MWCRALLWISLTVVNFCEFGNADCDVPAKSLDMQYKTGQIKPDNYPIDFPGNQTCVWTFPNHKFPNKALFLFIKEVDLIDGREAVADIRIGNENRFVHEPRANCRIYGINMSDLDLPGLLNYTHHLHEVEGRHCAAWHFDVQPLEQVSFRSLGKSNESFKNTFFMVYNYISINISDTEATSYAGTSTSYAGTSKPDFQQADGNEQTESPKNPNTEISSATCVNETTFTAVIIVLAVLLSITCAVLACHICKNRQTQNQTYKITPTVVVADTQSTDPQNYSNAAYASIDKRVNISAGQPPASLQTPMYDVPKNNRPRAPTAVSEQHYQVPSSIFAVEAEPQQPGEGRDVYAVVNKERK